MAVLELSWFQCFQVIIQQSKKHEKTIFLLLFRDENCAYDLRNITVVTSFIYNRHTLPVLFLSFVRLSKSLTKDFLSKANLADFR